MLLSACAALLVLSETIARCDAFGSSRTARGCFDDNYGLRQELQANLQTSCASAVRLNYCTTHAALAKQFCPKSCCMCGCANSAAVTATTSQVVYSVNTSASPDYCGQTIITGTPLFINYAVHAFTTRASVNYGRDGIRLHRGSCVQGGYPIPMPAPAGVSARQTYRPTDASGMNRSSGLRYNYVIKFFRKLDPAETVAAGQSTVVHHMNTGVYPVRCGQTVVQNKNLDATLTYMASSSAYGPPSHDAYPLVLGTCADAGFNKPAGPQPDVSSTLSFRYSIFTYGPYTVEFFHRGGKVVDQSVVGLAAKTANLSTFGAAVKAAGLGAALSAPGALTIFAPTNAAFKALGPAVATLLKPQNKALLVKVLKYHVVKGARMSSVFASGLKIATLEGQDIEFTAQNGKVLVNGAGIVKADLRATDDVVQIIDKVLLFPGFSLPACQDDGNGCQGVGQ